MKAWEVLNSPVFVISDLHLGDHGPRDSFMYGNRLLQFQRFLEYVGKEHGILVIAGDLFDFWQANLSSVIVKNLQVIYSLENLHATYILGNHDSDLNAFPHTRLLDLRIIDNAVRYLDLSIAGRKFTIIHGHEADPYCVSDTPGIGRITAIMTGLSEDRNGGPMASKFKTIGQKVVGPMDRAVSHLNWLRGKPSREKQINRELLKIRKQSEADVLISGHTHKAGNIGSIYYNSGCWCEFVNSFVRIDRNGHTAVWYWDADWGPIQYFKDHQLPW